jgi:neutral ceramidase
MTPGARPRPWLARVLAVCWLGSSACSTRSDVVVGPLHDVPRATGYLAAVTMADITPPLHLSLFGHGPEGRIATGVRLRLNCQIFVIARGGEVMALVPCDLQASSMALQRAVADKLRQIGLPITADRLFIMATHTHAAPGHYFDARRYSGTFSSRAPGYDERVLQFLANRIAGGIADAFAALEPACLGWKQTKVWNLTFNRSYVPFLANESSNEQDDPATLARRAEEGLQRARWETTPSNDPNETSTTERVSQATEEGATDATATVPTGAEKAIDPDLSVLALYRRAATTTSCEGSRLTGVLAIYGMHPTGAPNTNELYHGDIFGFATRAAEGLLSSQATRDERAGRESESADADTDHVIVGLANGVEGDISPKIDFQSMPEARKHGRALGQAIEALTRRITDASADGPLRHLAWDLRFPDGQYDADPTHKLCKHGELGMASAGGARDGPTRIRIVPAANAGFQPNRLSECHDQKVPLRNGTGHSPYDYPEVGTIALLQIANATLATTPGEATTTTGARIRRAIAPHLSKESQFLALAGLTNQYFQYFATHEEYPFQFYEGASTLYGPHSEQFLVRHFACLAALLDDGFNPCSGPFAINQPSPFEPSPSPRVSRWPDDEDVDVLSLERLDVRERRSDGALGWEMDIDALPLTFTANRSEFSVAVLSGDTGDAKIDDDRGASIEVRELDDDHWRIRWIPDLVCGDARCGQPFRLAVRGQVSLTSRPFVLTCEPNAEPCEP